MTQRTDKIAAFVEKTVAESAVRAIADQGLFEEFGPVSVRSVRVSKDLSYADVSVSSVTNADKLPKTLAKLAGEIRHELSRTVGLHRAPIIRFRTASEDAESEEIRVLALIDEISKHAGK